MIVFVCAIAHSHQWILNTLLTFFACVANPIYFLTEVGYERARVALVPIIEICYCPFPSPYFVSLVQFQQSVVLLIHVSPEYESSPGIIDAYHFVFLIILHCETIVLWRVFFYLLSLLIKVSHFGHWFETTIRNVFHLCLLQTLAVVPLQQANELHYVLPWLGLPLRLLQHYTFIYKHTTQIVFQHDSQLIYNIFLLSYYYILLLCFR